jgi:MFS family permease
MAAAMSTTVATFVGMAAGPLLVGVLSDMFETRYGDESLRYSLLVPTIAPLIGMIFCLLAARTIRAELNTGAN